MEDTLRAMNINSLKNRNNFVLILVLMEDTLRGEGFVAMPSVYQVLILVLMEDTLRASTRQPSLASVSCLNPCFNGRYS